MTFISYFSGLQTASRGLCTAYTSFTHLTEMVIINYKAIK